MRPGHPEFRGYLDTDGDGVLTDDERDADGDGLGNVEEIRGLMVPSYYPPGDECATRYGQRLHLQAAAAARYDRGELGRLRQRR